MSDYDLECRIDFETRSDVDLRKHGAAVYFASPHFKALGASYRIGDGPLQDWEYWQPLPQDLKEHIERGGFIRAFNAAFERQVFNEQHKRLGWPKPALDRYRCTAAEAAAMSLPRNLQGVGEALGLPIKKDKEGARLIRKFSIPRRARKNENPAGVYWNEPEDHPEDYRLFIAYRRTDVLTEEAAARRIVPLSTSEQAVYLLDQIINDRGVRIDRRSARAALAIADKAKAKLDREMKAVTGGYVTACSQPGKLVEWIQNQGVEIGSAAKSEITELLALDDLPNRVREALELRQEAAKTSVAKLQSMLDRASADGRVRGAYLYHGASTGRWSSTGVNLANMPRPRREFDEVHPRLDVLFEAFRQEDPDWLKFLYGDKLGRPMHLISDAIRGFVWAGPGKEFVQADYSGIEGAVIAWLAGEDWKVKALFDIIADPSIPDMYRQTAARIMGLTTDIITKKHPLRQSVGKVSELALGFAGGVAAFVSMAKNYAVNLDELYGPVWEVADQERREKAVKRYEGCAKRKEPATLALSREAWIACELIKVGWRAANPAIAQSWKDLEDAIRRAVQSPGLITEAARVRYIVRNGFLWAQLPSGRCLAYGSPRLKDQVWCQRLIDGELADAEVMDRDAAERLERAGEAKIQGQTSPKVTALGVNSVTKKWERFALYGGLAQENNTQGTARDLLVNGMWKAERAGYEIVTTVYDEILTEVPRGFGDVKEFERIICELPEWAAGLPLTASGWRGKRYRKD